MSPIGLPLLKKVLEDLICRKLNMPYYAVARGREVGVFESWDICRSHTANFKGAMYKKFDSEDTARDFVKQFRNKHAESLDGEASQAACVHENSLKASKEDIKEPSTSKFDFSAFNLRLTNLENSYQEKIRSLEERLEALENERGNTHKENEIEVEDDASNQPSLSGSSRINATKRKLLDSAGEILKPGSSRSYCTSALKKVKHAEPASGVALQGLAVKEVPFQVDCENFVTVYTDGACSKNGTGHGKAGIGVWFNDGHPLNVAAPVKGRATNNEAELQAVQVAAEVAAGSGIQKLCIFTDSKFTINCMTSWIGKWKKNNWKTQSGEPVINKESVLALEKALNSLEAVKWVHVRGHQGNHGNEQADRLARSGAEQYNYKIHS